MVCGNGRQAHLRHSRNTSGRYALTKGRMLRLARSRFCKAVDRRGGAGPRRAAVRGGGGGWGGGGSKRGGSGTACTVYLESRFPSIGRG